MGRYENLIQDFISCDLPKSRWTHEAHLIVALWFCSEYDERTAFDQMKMGIIRYNESIGTPNTVQRGYHETITRFWIYITRFFLKGRDKDSFDENVEHFLSSEWASKDKPLEYYQKETLFSPEARMFYVEPDIRPLEI